MEHLRKRSVSLCLPRLNTNLPSPKPDADSIDRHQMLEWMTSSINDDLLSVTSSSSFFPSPFSAEEDAFNDLLTLTPSQFSNDNWSEEPSLMMDPFLPLSSTPQETPYGSPCSWVSSSSTAVNDLSWMPSHISCDMNPISSPTSDVFLNHMASLNTSSPTSPFTFQDHSQLVLSPSLSSGRPRSQSCSVSSSKDSGELKRNIKCPNPGCDKTFFRPYNLKSHMICHTKDRPHSCQVCGSAFARKHDLQRHIRTLHGFYRSYKCGQCSLSFVRIESLRRHILNEAHVEGLASVSQGNKVLHTLTFAELEQLIIYQNTCGNPIVDQS